MGQIVICCVYEMPKQRGYFKRDHNKICWTIGQIVHLQQSSISFTSLDSTASLPRYIQKTTYFLCLSCLIFSNWGPAEQWYFPQRWVFFGSTHGYMKHFFSPMRKKWANLSLFLFIFVLFKYKLHRKICSPQQDLNLDRRSRKQALWPFYHHHGPILAHA